MSAMIRTQVYIPRDVYEELKRRSKSTGLAMAEQIRQALREYLEREEGVVLREDDPIFSLVASPTARSDNPAAGSSSSGSGAGVMRDADSSKRRRREVKCAAGMSSSIC